LTLEQKIDALLDAMWERRETQIFRMIGIKMPGAQVIWNRKKRTEKTEELLDLVEKFLTRRYSKLKKNYDRSWKHLSQKYIRLKGGPDNKKKRAYNWASKEIASGGKKSFIYILWRGKDCLYVGQSTVGGKRFIHHHRADPWVKATRLEIRSPRNARNLDFLECMTIHLYSPYYNQKLVGKRAGSGGCRICKRLNKIQKELEFAFALN